MAYLQETDDWGDGIYQLEQTDVALGGEGGTMNQQPQQLANRLLWLKNRMRVIPGGVKAISANTTGTTDDLLSVIKFTAKATYTLPVTGVLAGTYLSAICSVAGVLYGTILPASGSIVNGNTTVSQIYLYDSEKATLFFNGTSWEVLQYNGALFTAGEEMSARSQLKGTLIKQGQLLNRTDYPRLFAYIQSLGSYGVVADATWLSNVQYQGFFSLGNGTSTFRLPDDRGMFDRYIDIGRGLDNGRGANSSYAGSYEADALRAHQHNLFANVKTGSKGPGTTDSVPWSSNSSNGNQDYDMCKTATAATLGLTSSAGGTETRPVNIAKYPLIKY